ncbi:MAG: AAA family ATPase [Actinomycetota bacterium]|nr:AAA family ATPase [Actinomycetota bacterium]
MKQSTGAARSLLGRNRELTLLRVTLAAALDGGGSIVLLGGEAGIGKTRLAQELARFAEARRAIVAWGSAAGYAAPPYWPWVQVLQACARASETDALSAPHPAAEDLEDLLAGPRPQVPGLGSLASAEGARRPVSPAESQQLRLRLFGSFFTRLQESARSRPLVIVLDDLQWADTSSLLLLEFVANQLHDNRLLILGLYRDSDLVPRSPLSHGLARLSRLGTVIRLTGLTADESVRLAGDVASSPVSERVALLVHERSRGNPFFIREVVRLLESQGRLKSLTQRGASSVSMLPQTIAEAIYERLAHAPETARVLGEAAVIGEEFVLDVLAEITGASEADLADVLEAAKRLELIQVPEDAATYYRFAHSLIREAFYADLPASQRADLHRRVGEAIELRSEKPESQASALAHHFDLASTADTREKALYYARQAGRRSLQLLAYEEAAEHFALALDLLDQLGGEESQHLELLLALGDARMGAGHRQEAVEAYDRAATSARHLGQAEELARAALGLGVAGSRLEARSVDQRQIDLLEEARAALGEEDSALRAWVLARLSLAAIGRKSPEQRADLSRSAVEVARRVGDARALADSLGSYCHAISGPANTEERLMCALEMVRIGEETGDAEIELLGRRFRLPALLEMGDIRAVDEEVEAFARIAEALRPPLYLWYVPLWRGMRALMEGRLAESERLVAETRALGRQAANADADLLAETQHLGWLIESGLDHQARDLVARLLNDPGDVPNAELFLVPLLARSGRTAEAHATLSRLFAEDFSRLEVQDATWLLATCMLAWGCVEIGDREVGAKVYDLLLPYEQRFAPSRAGAATVGSVSRYLGLLAHALGRFAEAHAHFGRALAAHQRVGASLLVAHTLRQHAAMLLERGDRGDRNRSEGLLREAISIYSELGLAHWAKAARELPGVEPEQPVEADGANVFRRDGDVWLLRFDGEEARVKDTRGLRAIARLLASPGRDFHVLDLVTDTVPAHTEADADVRNEQGHAEKMSDERARAEYRQRLAVLEKEIDEAVMGDDPERASRAQVERRAILAQLTASYGLAGRPGRGGDPIERAQSTMAWRIGSALGRIERAHPALASHLRHSIRIGMFCSYSPDWATSWAVE